MGYFYGIGDAAGLQATSEKGVANGYADLDSLGYVPAARLPSEVINVKRYGAVGNGTTDDSVAIQQALTAAGTGAAVYLPAGTYLVATALTFTPTDSDTDSVTIFGDGQAATTINYTGAGWAIASSTPATLCSHLRISGLSIVGTATAAGGGLRLQSMQRSHFENILFSSFTHASAHAILLDGSTSSSSGSTSNTFSHIDVRSCTNGIKFTGDVNGKSNANRIRDSRISVSVAGGICVNFDSGDTNVLDGCTLYPNATNAVAFRTDGTRDKMVNCRAEAGTGTGHIGAQIGSSAVDAVIDASLEGFTTRIDDLGTDTHISPLGTNLGRTLMLGGIFVLANVAASSSDVTVPLLGLAASVSDRFMPLFRGSVAGLSWRWNAAVTGGTYTLHIERGGTSQKNTGAVSAQLSQLKCTPGEVTFTAAQTINISIDTDASFAPAGSNDLTVYLWVWQ